MRSVKKIIMACMNCHRVYYPERHEGLEKEFDCPCKNGNFYNITDGDGFLEMTGIEKLKE